MKRIKKIILIVLCALYGVASIIMLIKTEDKVWDIVYAINITASVCSLYQLIFAERINRIFGIDDK